MRDWGYGDENWIEEDKYWIEYERRVQKLEAEGLTRSDAQAVVDAENLQSEEDE
jgi:hypothetical protein